MKSLLVPACCHLGRGTTKSPIPLCLVGLSVVPPPADGEGLWGVDLSSQAG